MTKTLRAATAKPIVLVILDGFGHSEERQHNAIASAQTPHLDKLWQECPHKLIEGSGNYVGLPSGQMGNSEVGHLNLGAGRIVYQDLSRIQKAIVNEQFFDNPAINHAIDRVQDNNSALHILGLLSPGGVHSHETHIEAMVKLAAQRNVSKLYIHAFLDGRDTAPKSAAASIARLEEQCNQCNSGQIVSLIGRYYAMDRDHRWQRIQAAYDLLTQGKAARHAETAQAGLEMAYAAGENDEFVTATTIHAADSEAITINDHDAIIFMNFRADRARQITHAFVDSDFTGFARTKTPALCDFVTLTEYEAGMNATCAFAPASLENVLGDYLAQHGCKQLRIAETEKYAHVTFFFNGGAETPFPGEERLLIPSPKVATYDLQPEMSAPLLTDKLVAAIASRKYDCIICNYANADMVGHTGNFAAAVNAIEALDQCLGRVADSLKQIGGELLITADHGNAEKMYNEETGQPHTAHTSYPVPFIYMGRPAKMRHAKAALEDIAPTILTLMGLPIPQEMTGSPLLSLL
ncbi:MAG: 2,3-bisphosphoglycerate-independent phosphoglycerate mutase [Gammaproteobacteria bacterium]|nr:2,3-bisphosphoglycerate-independent phosphoglycerate mutase [Gammaproteobacteria bacterium]